MKETYQCPAGGCDHPPLKAPSHCEAISETYMPDFLQEKSPAREVPIAEEDSAILLNRLG